MTNTKGHNQRALVIRHGFLIVTGAERQGAPRRNTFPPWRPQTNQLPGHPSTGGGFQKGTTSKTLTTPLFSLAA